MLKNILSLNEKKINKMNFNEVRQMTKEIVFLYKNSAESLSLDEKNKLERIIHLLNQRGLDLLKKTRAGRILARKGLKRVEKMKEKGENPNKIIDEVK